MRLQRIVAVALVSIVACARQPPREPDIVIVMPDAGHGCDSACAVLAELQCPNVAPASASCVDFCVANSDLLDVPCVAAQRTRGGLARCHVRCP